MKQRIVVIGNGMVGHHFVDKLASSEKKGEFEISVLSAEPRLAYDRVHLSEFFAGKSADELAMIRGGWACKTYDQLSSVHMQHRN